MADSPASGCGHDLCDANETGFHYLDHASNVIQRVVRSTLAVESYAMGWGMDRSDWNRTVLAWASGADFSQGWEQAITERPHHSLVDAMSVKAHLMKDTGKSDDKRVAIECAMLRQRIRRHNEFVHWIDTRLMPADVLTKKLPDRGAFLWRILSRNKISVQSTPLMLAMKDKQRQQRQQRRQAIRDGRTADAKSGDTRNNSG